MDLAAPLQQRCQQGVSAVGAGQWLDPCDTDKGSDWSETSRFCTISAHTVDSTVIVDLESIPSFGRQMSENVFYSEAKSIVETALKAALDVLGHSKRDKLSKDPRLRRKPAKNIGELLTHEATRKISSIFSQLFSMLHKENLTLRGRVGQLESELNTMTVNYENSRMWRESVLNGCPVLFEKTGLMLTLKPFGKLIRNPDKLTEGVVEASPAAGIMSGHNTDGGEAEEELISETECSPDGRQNTTQDYCQTNMAESKNNDSQNSQEAEVSHKQKVFECEICHKRFNRPFHLHKHIITHKDLWPFACQQCPRKFRNTAALECHLLRHEEKNQANFKCQHCEKVFKTKMHLKAHHVVHRDTRPFPCSTCGKGFKTKRNLRSHQVVHTVEKPHKCSECGEGFRYAFTLQVHKSIHTGDHPYKCTVCSKTFLKRRSLSRHQTVHSGRKFTCETCGKGFTLQHNLKRHIRIHTGERPYTCLVCGQRFIQDNKLRSHMLLHGASKSFMCDLCGKTFLYNCELQKHQRVTHNEKHNRGIRRRSQHSGNRRVIYRKDRTTVDLTPFSCKTCHKGFDSANSLKRHELIHTGQMQYNCETCGRSFFYKATFDYHQRIHSGDRPFACDVCGKRFIIPQALKSHKLQHSGEKPHKCEQCGKAFRIYTNYLRHLRIHTGEKPYECEVCGVRFRQLGHVKFHMQVHTGERPYSCSSCGLRFSDSRLLKRHKCPEKY